MKNQTRYYKAVNLVSFAFASENEVTPCKKQYMCIWKEGSFILRETADDLLHNATIS